MTWRKSSRSGTNGCVEVSLPEWRKSSRSSDGACVEVAHTDGAVLVRDSKHPQDPVLRFNQQEWQAFVAGVLAGEFNLEEP
jgi:predicted secreted Zn-dependent protease